MSQHDSHDGEIAVVTGASNGIGLETAKELSMLGYEVVMVCREGPRAAAARLTSYCHQCNGVQSRVAPQGKRRRHHRLLSPLAAAEG